MLVEEEEEETETVAWMAFLFLISWASD